MPDVCTRSAADGRPLSRFFAAAAAHRGRAASAVAGVVFLGLLAGCNSNPEPEALPSESPSATATSPSSSASPTPTLPAMPAAAKGTSEASAKAFVRYWVDTLNYAGATGDVSELDQISATQCDACTAVIAKIDSVYSAGGYFRGKGWSVSGMKYQPLQPRNRPVLSVSIMIAPQRLLESPGGQPTNFEGGKRSMIFRLGNMRGDWSALQVEQTQ